MTRAVLFDVDGTLVDLKSSGVRELFFSRQTREVFEQLVERGDRVIISSNGTRKDEIEASLNAAGIDISELTILGTHETYGYAPTHEWLEYGLKESLLLDLLEDSNNGITEAVIVEDATTINDDDARLMHIQVPYQVGSKGAECPASDGYLQAALLPFKYLEAMKPTIQEVKEGIRGGRIDSARLETRYDNMMRLAQYQGLREMDPREYTSKRARFFGGEKRSRTAKLAAVDTMLDNLRDKRFNKEERPPAATNGELERIVNRF